MPATTTDKNINILLVEDNYSLAEEIIYMLNDRSDYTVAHTPTIIGLFQTLNTHRFDIIILDRFLPDGDSINHLQTIKQQYNGFIIILTAANDAQDRIHSLNHGADYYLTKPIHLDELTAVINTLMRRLAPNKKLWYIDDTKSYLVAPNGHAVSMTAREINIIETLMNHTEKAISKENLLQIIKANPTQEILIDEYDIKRIETTIYRIRKKIQQVYQTQNPITNIYGIGYIWKDIADISI